MSFIRPLLQSVDNRLNPLESQIRTHGRHVLAVGLALFTQGARDLYKCIVFWMDSIMGLLRSWKPRPRRLRMTKCTFRQPNGNELWSHLLHQSERIPNSGRLWTCMAARKEFELFNSMDVSLDPSIRFAPLFSSSFLSASSLRSLCRSTILSNLNTRDQIHTLPVHKQLKSYLKFHTAWTLLLILQHKEPFLSQIYC